MIDERDPQFQTAMHRFESLAPFLRIRRHGQWTRLHSHLKETLGDGEVPSRATLYRHRSRYREKNLEGLTRRKRSDAGRTVAIPPDIQSHLVDLKTRYPQLTTPMIIEIVEQEVSLAPGTLKKPTVNRLLRRYRLEHPPEGKKGFGHFHVNRPMEVWVGDMAVGPSLPHPSLAGRRRNTVLCLWEDAYSRLITAARYYHHEDQISLDDSLKRAIRDFNVPERVFVDNGKVYTSSHLRMVCGRLGIELRHAKPYRPQGKGQVERLIQTIQKGFESVARIMIDEGQIPSLDDLNDSLSAWILERYQSRVHSETGQTPIERMGAVTRYPDSRKLDQIFLWSVRRKVNKTREISLGGNRYLAGDHLVGQTVTVRYDPLRLDQVFIEEEAMAPAPAIATPDNPLSPGSYLKRRSPAAGHVPTVDVRIHCQTLLQDVLGRPISSQEEALLQGAHLPSVGMISSLEPSLRAFVQERGPDHHLSVYLQLLGGKMA